MGANVRGMRPSSCAAGKRAVAGVRLPAADGGSELRNRQRVYDDRRAGRVRTPQHAVVRPVPKVFDANATCNHCFKPVRVRRDENGRLQPQLSNRLARMSVPTFLGLPLVRATLHPAPCTLHKPKTQALSRSAR